MTTPRRRLIRPSLPPVSRPVNDRQIHRLRSRLELERATLARWMSRLRRAFHAVEKSQLRVARIERQLVRLEN